MEYIYKFKCFLQIQLNELKEPTPSYTEDGKLIENSLDKSFFEYTNKKEKLEFSIKQIEEFIQSEVDGIEKSFYDNFNN